jgi:hypothetical protein
VQPEASVSVEELFSREEGFLEAINGIYTRCTGNMFYGGLSSVELQDAFMQNYSFEPLDYTSYARTAAFDFDDEMLKWRVASTWSEAYSAIMNCNLILEHVDKSPALFRDGIQELVKGEALALRAYLHFDLARLFSRPYATGADQQAIPYATTFSNRVAPLSSVGEVIERVLDDLKEAKRLLANDPIREPGYVVGYNTDVDSVTEQANGNLFLQNRRHRLNYYAVGATLARAYLYKGDLEGALREATEVINARKFRWADPVAVLATEEERDRVMYPELVFAWYNEKNATNLQDRFNNVTTGYFVHAAHLRNIYEVESSGGGDYRFNGWFKLSTSNEKYQLIKYARNASGTGDRHFLVIPAIRLSEMYYIAAEATYPGDPALAWQYLDTVRLQRNVVAPRDDFHDALLKEYRKETFAEGQAFYAYKRLVRSITTEAGLLLDPARVYAIPLPDDEIEFGER